MSRSHGSCLKMHKIYQKLRGYSEYGQDTRILLARRFCGIELHVDGSPKDTVTFCYAVTPVLVKNVTCPGASAQACAADDAAFAG